jgi:Tfp pilus assembly protein PilN
MNSIKDIKKLVALPKTSLGVDISDDKISLALLQRTKDGVKVLKAASGPVPEGAVEQGNVKDAALLARAVKSLRSSCKIGGRRAVVSLFAHPVLTQIMQMPGNLPSNIGQYVQKEARHCAVLPCKNILSDYCGISPCKSGRSRVFTVATEIEKVHQLIKALSEVGINVEAIEPAELACARALYEKEIVGNLGCNVLIALVEDSEATLMVFRNQTLDFVRKRNIGEDICQSEQGRGRFAEEIDAIIHYYAMEVDETLQNWRLVTVVRQDGQNVEEVSGFLQNRFADLEIEVVSEVGACKNMPFAVNPGAESACLIAAGLAMRLLDVPQPKLKMNLMPPKSAEVRAVKQDVLVAANIAVAILLAMILAVAVLKVSLSKMDEAIAQKKKEQSSFGMSALLVERTKLEREANSLHEELKKLNGMLHSGYTGDWSIVLDDIRRRTPESLWITNLSGGSNLGLVVKGWSISYEAIHRFVNTLSESKYIDSANLVEAEKNEGAGGLVSYSVDCSLVVPGGT